MIISCNLREKFCEIKIVKGLGMNTRVYEFEAVIKKCLT